MMKLKVFILKNGEEKIKPQGLEICFKVILLLKGNISGVFRLILSVAVQDG